MLNPIRDKREEAGLSVPELARRSGLSPFQIVRLEADQIVRITEEQFRDLSRALALTSREGAYLIPMIRREQQPTSTAQMKSKTTSATYSDIREPSGGNIPSSYLADPMRSPLDPAIKTARRRTKYMEG